MSEIERIADQLERDHDGDPWHGSPVRAILDGVSAAQAAARPVPDAHSIWEIVLHVTAWKNEARRRVLGGVHGEPVEGDWPRVDDVSGKAWQDALRQLDLSHRELVATVKQMREAQLFEPTRDPRNRATGAGEPHYVLLHGIVQHDAYHGGQLALLKKALLR